MSSTLTSSVNVKYDYPFAPWFPLWLAQHDASVGCGFSAIDESVFNDAYDIVTEEDDTSRTPYPVGELPEWYADDNDLDIVGDDNSLPVSCVFSPVLPQWPSAYQQGHCECSVDRHLYHPLSGWTCPCEDNDCTDCTDCRPGEVCEWVPYPYDAPHTDSIQQPCTCICHPSTLDDPIAYVGDYEIPAEYQQGMPPCQWPPEAVDDSYPMSVTSTSPVNHTENYEDYTENDDDMAMTPRWGGIGFTLGGDDLSHICLTSPNRNPLGPIVDSMESMELEPVCDTLADWDAFCATLTAMSVEDRTAYIQFLQTPYEEGVGEYVYGSDVEDYPELNRSDRFYYNSECEF